MTVVRLKSLSRAGIESHKLLDLQALRYAQTGPVKIKVQSGDRLALEVDAATGQSKFKELLKTKKAKLKKLGDALVIEIDGQVLAQLEGFYTEADVRLEGSGLELPPEAGLQELGTSVQPLGPEAAAALEGVTLSPLEAAASTPSAASSAATLSGGAASALSAAQWALGLGALAGVALAAGGGGEARGDQGDGGGEGDGDGDGEGPVKVNQAPTASNATIQSTEDLRFVFSVANFGFQDGADTPAHALKNVIITRLPAVGSLQLNGTALAVGAVVSRQDIEQGKLSFLPAENAHGSAYATLQFKVQDDGGVSQGGQDTSGQYTLTFDVQSVNDAPTVTRSASAIVWATGVESDKLLDFRDFFTDDNDASNLSFVLNADHLPAGVEVSSGDGATILRGRPTSPGPFSFTVKARDSAGLETSLLFEGVIEGDLRFGFDLPAITSLDVDGQLVLTAASLAGAPSDVLAVGGVIRLVHTTDASRTQEVDVTDARFVTIQGSRVIIKPPFDFDFGGAYRVEVDANAFKATVAGVSETVSRAMVAGDDLGFGTVSLAGATTVGTAAQGQVVSDAGVVSDGKKWIDGTGQGDWLGGAAAEFDLSGADYAVVVKDAGTNAGRVDQGDGVQGEGFNLRLLNVGSADRIYVDDVANDKAALNDRAFTQIVDDGSGGLNLIFNATDSATNANYIQIASVESGSGSGSGLDLTLPESIRGLLNVSNTRLGTQVTAIERVGADAAQDFGGDLGVGAVAGASLEAKVTASFRAGDKVQLMRLDADGNEVSWGAEVSVGAGDVSNGHITLSQSSLTDLVQGRNTIYAKVTGADGAVTKSAMLFAAQGGLAYDTTAPEPVLSVLSSEDSLTPEVSEDGTLTDTETSVLIHVDGWTVGDKLQLKLDGADLGPEVVITEAMLDANGQLYVSVNKSDLGAAGAKEITATVTDRSGNVGTTAAALGLEVLAYVQLSGAITAGLLADTHEFFISDDAQFGQAHGFGPEAEPVAAPPHFFEALASQDSWTLYDAVIPG